MYSVGMADFTPEEVIQVVLDGRKCAGADLQDIDLRGANLHGANLTGADLRVAGRHGADLGSANLHGAKYNANTQWPYLFDPQAAGAVMVDG